MEPDAAVSAIAGGAAWVVGWCGAQDSLYRLSAAPDALHDAQARTVSPEENRRQLRKGQTKGRWATVVIAEEWIDGDGNRLIFYREGPPSDGSGDLPDLRPVGLV
jgi:hypothetical protein